MVKRPTRLGGPHCEAAQTVRRPAQKGSPNGEAAHIGGPAFGVYIHVLSSSLKIASFIQYYNWGAKGIEGKLM